MLGQHVSPVSIWLRKWHRNTTVKRSQERLIHSGIPSTFVLNFGSHFSTVVCVQWAYSEPVKLGLHWKKSMHWNISLRAKVKDKFWLNPGLNLLALSTEESLFSVQDNIYLLRTPWRKTYFSQQECQKSCECSEYIPIYQWPVVSHLIVQCTTLGDYRRPWFTPCRSILESDLPKEGTDWVLHSPKKLIQDWPLSLILTLAITRKNTGLIQSQCLNTENTYSMIVLFMCSVCELNCVLG